METLQTTTIQIKVPTDLLKEFAKIQGYNGADNDVEEGAFVSSYLYGFLGQ